MMTMMKTNKPKRSRKYHDDPRREDEDEQEVAMTVIASSSHKEGNSNDGVAIFNPLVDAPPKPPPISYQHSSFPANSSNNISSNATNTQNNNSEMVEEGPSNYYYSSHRDQHSNIYKAPPFHSPGIAFELELQRRQQQRNRCRIALFVAILLFVSWRSHHYWSSVPVESSDFADEEKTNGISAQDMDQALHNSTLFKSSTSTTRANP